MRVPTDEETLEYRSTYTFPVPLDETGFDAMLRYVARNMPARVRVLKEVLEDIDPLSQKPIVRENRSMGKYSVRIGPENLREVCFKSEGKLCEDLDKDLEWHEFSSITFDTVPGWRLEAYKSCGDFDSWLAIRNAIYAFFLDQKSE
ncbi:hypothetical protein KY335_04425 [Candidatus Woesearchaeota archaeon]|nr:hypothetical protein [Candidatus Woesearchaeota archaeon]